MPANDSLVARVNITSGAAAARHSGNVNGISLRSERPYKL
jgi:hypothetical protein